VLVLSRRIGQSVVIGDDVVVSVLEVRGDVVRIGIDAPRSVAVNRSEILEQVEETNRAAASPAETVVADLSKLLARPPRRK
jgi:carbon storage regulator